MALGKLGGLSELVTRGAEALGDLKLSGNSLRTTSDASPVGPLAFKASLGAPPQGRHGILPKLTGAFGSAGGLAETAMSAIGGGGPAGRITEMAEGAFSGKAGGIAGMAMGALGGGGMFGKIIGAGENLLAKGVEDSPLSKLLDVVPGGHKLKDAASAVMTEVSKVADNPLVGTALNFIPYGAVAGVALGVLDKVNDEHHTKSPFE